MSISSEITKLQNNLTKAYTSCQNKKATIPAKKNFDNLSTTIDSIPASEVGVPRKIISGRFCANNTTSWIIPENVTILGDYSACYAFNQCGVLQSVNLENIQTIGMYALQYAFVSSGLKTVSMTSLKTLNERGLLYTFNNCKYLKTVGDFENLELIEWGGMDSCFYGSAIETAPNFPKLKNIYYGGMQYTFAGCDSLTTAPRFDSLEKVNENGFYRTFYYCDTGNLANADFVFPCTTLGLAAFNGCFYYADLRSFVFPNLEESMYNNMFYYFNYGNFDSLFKGQVAHPFPKLKKITGNNVFGYAFPNTKPYRFVFDALEEICVENTGTTTFQYAFQNSIFQNENGDYGGVYFPCLRQIGSTSTSTATCLKYICSGATGEVTLDFPELTIVYNTLSSSTSGAMSYCGATKVYMPKVTNLGTYNKYNFYSATTILELHFGIENQVTIEAMNGFSSKFGATKATIYFDLVNHITVDGVVYDRYGANYDYDNDYYSWINGETVIYTDKEYENAVGDNVFTKSDDVYTAIGTISGVA